MARLPFDLRCPVDATAARAGLRSRLAGRDAAFLDLVSRGVLANPANPTAALLRHAGCELPDLERSLGQDGLEATLERLFAAGVYLTVDEFKGRRPVRRGSLEVEAGPDRMRNPRAAHHVAAASGGSRSAGTPVFIDMEFVRSAAGNLLLFLADQGADDTDTATWEVPGAGARFRLLKFSSLGRPPAAWFSQVDPSLAALHPVFRWNTRAIRAASLLALRPVPLPVFCPPADPAPALAWLAAQRSRGRRSTLFTFPSTAVALGEAAARQGVGLDHVHLILGGEPITRARLTAATATGARAVPRYGSVECGPIAYGCLAPSESDDAHLLADLHALVQPGAAGAAAGLPEKTLLVTALHPRAPFALLNVSMGDAATLEQRDCGCPLEERGWHRHLREIRSFEKLTAGGMTFLGTDVARILEETLPATFGGGPTHYQLCEEEQPDGRATLSLLVSPEVGAISEAAVAEAFLAALGQDTPAETMMTEALRGTVALRVERRQPRPTQAGKLLHVHLLRRR
jgi:hypothetical protein